MLSPSEYEHLCDQLMTLYDDLDNAIINDMVRRMMRMGRVSEATAWQARQLQQSGLLYDDILSEIASRTDASEAQVRTLFEDAGVQSIRNDNSSYTAAGLESIIRLSPAALQTLNAGYMKCSGDLKNMTLTTANTAQTAYINACDLAYMEVTSGTMDYGTAIRRAVQSAAGEGSWVLYPTGHRDRLDVAVRRSVLTGVGQTVRQISVINANDMGCDLMEITAHSGARPSHAVWQGKLASLSGKNAGRTIDGAKVYSLRDIGYGEADGFGGVNCRHDWFPFFEGISSRAYSDERLQQLNARNIEYNGKMYTEYEIDQMQRKLERKIREMKRRVSAADTAVREAPDDQTANQMKDLFTSESVKLKKAEQNLKDFLSQTGNLNDSTRTWVNGFGRSTAQKAVYANKKAQQKKNSSKLLTSSSSGDQNVQSDKDTFNRAKNKLSGKEYLNKILDFHSHLPIIKNRTVSSLLQKAYDKTVFEKSKKKNSYFSPNDDKVYITNSTTPSTVAHELFHKIDFDNNISHSGMLDNCIKSDYENLKKMAKNAGLSIEDMLYLKYPEAFEKQGKMKEEYRGISDIINGMTNCEVKLGYGHNKINEKGETYWESNPFSLQKETFAQYGRIYFEENPDVLKMVNELFPETSKEINSIMNIVNLYGR